VTTDPLIIWAFALRLALNAATLLAIGLAAAAAMGVIRPDERRGWRGAVRTLAALVIVLAGLRGLLGAVQLNGGLEGALSPDLLGMVGRFQGPSLCALIAGAALTALGGRLAPILGAIMLASGYGLIGHTRALEAPGPAPLVAALHVMIAGVWLAAPLVLWPRAGVSDARLAERLTRFGALARWLVPLLFIGGGWLALRLAGGFEPLVGSTYGRLLLAKLGAAGIALALGAANAFLVTRAVAEDGLRGRRLLKLTLGLDALLFTAALMAISAATSFVGPPG
jgi:putative copper export protein